jgi:hypothetical protein
MTARSWDGILWLFSVPFPNKWPFFHWLLVKGLGSNAHRNLGNCREDTWSISFAWFLKKKGLLSLTAHCLPSPLASPTSTPHSHASGAHRCQQTWVNSPQRAWFGRQVGQESSATQWFWKCGPRAGHGGPSYLGDGGRRRVWLKWQSAYLTAQGPEFKPQCCLEKKNSKCSDPWPSSGSINRKLVRIQISRPHPQPNESEPWKWDPALWGFVLLCSTGVWTQKLGKCSTTWATPPTLFVLVIFEFYA